MPVDADHVHELFVELARVFGEPGAKTLMKALREISESRVHQERNRENFAARPDDSFVIYAAMRRHLPRASVRAFMALLDPLGWESSATTAVALSDSGGDHGRR
jgi:hypothetical protein